MPCGIPSRPFFIRNNMPVERAKSFVFSQSATGDGWVKQKADSAGRAEAKLAATYNATPATRSDGETSTLENDAAGNLKATLGTTIAGEDIANDVTKVEQRFSATNIAAAATTVVKSGAGFLHAIIINAHVATGVITIYDNTAAAGTVIATITCGANVLSDPPITAIYDVSFSTGLTIVTTQNTNLTVSYR